MRIRNIFLFIFFVNFFIKASTGEGVSQVGTLSSINQADATLNILSYGPSATNISVPANGKGYIYFNLTSDNVPVFYENSFQVALTKPDASTYNAEAIFVDQGVLRLTIPNEGFNSQNNLSFTLPKMLHVSDTLYNIQGTLPTFTATKTPMIFNRSWDIFAGGSAGVSGSVGSIGLGASIAAAKISIKGSGGMGLKITLDQDKNLFIDRRLEYSIGLSAEVPSINLIIGDIKVGASANIVTKTIVGQQFSFDGLTLSDDTKKMAKSGLMLETLALGGANISPIVGVFLKAVVNTINSSAGITPTFQEASIKDYWGFGLEGSIGAGFSASIGPLKLSTLNPTAGIAIKGTRTNYNTNNPNNSLVVFSNELSLALNFNFSDLDFGFKYNDKVGLNSGNFSLFDASGGMEFSALSSYDGNNKLNNLEFGLSGGGSYSIFGANRNTYYNTFVSIPITYTSVLTDNNNGLSGIFNNNFTLPLGITAVNNVVSSLKLISNNFKNNPVAITTNEIRGRGIDFNFGVNLDVALGVGLGLSLGVELKYFDELSFPKKYSEIYSGNKNYLIYSSSYYPSMLDDSFNQIMTDMFSGTALLIKTALLNLLFNIDKAVNAGQQYVLSGINKVGTFIGKISGIAQNGGKFTLSLFGAETNKAFGEAFNIPTVKNIYYSTNVKHKKFLGNGLYKITDVNTTLILVSENMKVSFIPDGQTQSLDSLGNPFELKILVDYNRLTANGFDSNDKNRIKIYRYVDASNSWILKGGSLNNDTLTVSTKYLANYALGIELTDANDVTPPDILEYGPQQGSLQSSLPKVYAKVKDNDYGVGIDYTNTFIIVNGDTVNYSINPTINEIYYQLSETDSIATGVVNVKVVVTDYNNNTASKDFSFNLNITGVREEKIIRDYKLYQNYPNPFNPTTTINYFLSQRANVKISIYNALGQYIGILVNKVQEGGSYSITFNADKLPSGVYFYSMSAHPFDGGLDYREIKKMILLK